MRCRQRAGEADGNPAFEEGRHSSGDASSAGAAGKAGVSWESGVLGAVVHPVRDGRADHVFVGWDGGRGEREREGGGRRRVKGGGGGGNVGDGADGENVWDATRSFPWSSTSSSTPLSSSSPSTSWAPPQHSPPSPPPARTGFEVLRGGGPKGGGGKANAKVKKAVEDKTFGLKNKSKSKKVQQLVHSVKKQVEDSMYDKKKQDQHNARKAKREEEKRREEEERLLFGKQETAKSGGGDDNNGQSVKEMLEDYEYQSSISALGKPLQTGDGQVEHEIEALRAKIKNDEKEPVTQDWFEKWAEGHLAKLETGMKWDKVKRLTGKEIFEKGGMGGDVGDDEEAEDSWMSREEEEEEEEDGEEERGEGGGGDAAGDLAEKMASAKVS